MSKKAHLPFYIYKNRIAENILSFYRFFELIIFSFFRYYFFMFPRLKVSIQTMNAIFF